MGNPVAGPGFPPQNRALVTTLLNAQICRMLEFIEAGVVRSRDFVDGECPLAKLPALLQEMTTGNRAAIFRDLRDRRDAFPTPSNPSALA